VSVATSATGAVLDRQEYGPWGSLRSGNVSETTLNYTGQKRDGTGLLYYGARYYDPALGRFLSPDSIGTNLANPQTLNRYSYVGNNPLNRTDPTGHCGGGGPEGNDCASEPTAGGGDRGSDRWAAENGGGDGGGHDGGETFADLVQAIDQIDNAIYHVMSSPGPFTPGPSVLCSGNGVGCVTNPLPGIGTGVVCSGGGTGCATNPLPGIGSGVVCSGDGPGCASNPFPNQGSNTLCSGDGSGCVSNPSPIGSGTISDPAPAPWQVPDGILAAGRGQALGPSESPVWQGLDPYRGPIKTDGDRYYTYDRLHGEWS